MSKLLAEWFWCDRWDGSSAAGLPLEARGLYREMLTQAWRRGAILPNDPETIQRLIRCTSAEWARCWPKVKRYWKVRGDDLVNETQLEVYAECVKRHAVAVIKGKKGGRPKLNLSPALPSAKAEPKLKVKPPYPSPVTESRTVAVAVRTNGNAGTEPAGPSSVRANPLVEGRREELEARCLALVREIAAKTGEEPTEVIAAASQYKGSAKTNPASMTDDRLLHTVRDLEKQLKNAKAAIVDPEQQRRAREWREANGISEP